MLSALYSFDGRFNRLQYLGWTIVSIFVLAVLAVGMAVVAMFAFASSFRGMRPEQILHSPSLWLFGGIAMLIFALPGLALATKRLRDIGLNALIWIPAYIGFSVFDTFVISRFVHATPGHGTIIGGIASLLCGLFLLLMPGRDDEDSKPDMSYLAPELERMRRDAKPFDYQPDPYSPQPSRQPSVRAPLRPATPQGFGRRR